MESKVDYETEVIADVRSGIVFSRAWAMPNRDTFCIKPIGEFVARYLKESMVSVDPFARDFEGATYRNDLNRETKASYHLDSIEFLCRVESEGIAPDLVLFDPPYSPRQIKECYDSVGLKMAKLDAMRTNWKAERDIMARIQPIGGVVLSFGWNSMGMGKNRGYEIIEGFIVCHGVGHNDTICMAERKAR